MSPSGYSQYLFFVFSSFTIVCLAVDLFLLTLPVTCCTFSIYKDMLYYSVELLWKITAKLVTYNDLNLFFLVLQARSQKSVSWAKIKVLARPSSLQRLFGGGNAESVPHLFQFASIPRLSVMSSIFKPLSALSSYRVLPCVWLCDTSFCPPLKRTLVILFTALHNWE